QLQVDQAHADHSLKHSRPTPSGKPVKGAPPAGDRPLELGNEFEVGRPAGVKRGTPLDLPIAINLNPIPLPPDGVFVWQLSIDDHSEEDWRLTFATRPATTHA